MSHGTTSLQIADRLRDDIVHGVLPPGTRLRQEELAERYGASRVPVREALKALEAEGLVTLVANAGAWVSQLTLNEIAWLNWSSGPALNASKGCPSRVNSTILTDPAGPLGDSAGRSVTRSMRELGKIEA